ncbi:MAG TPA: hypothetical protein VJ011_01345, partial [Steroidobacteraceae bacterium]|nr:hypothetical protein [Steroidobacteraceae bacterium]
FRVGEEDIELIADRTRALPVNDPFDRELTVSCGAALFNLRVAAAAVQLDALVELLPAREDPDVLARVTLAMNSGRRFHDADALAGALPRRRTYRRQFLPQVVDRSQIEALCAAATLEGVHMEPFITGAGRSALGELIAEGDGIQWEDPHWRRELAAWLHPRRQGDGLNMPGFAVPTAQLIMRSFDMGDGVAARHLDVVRGSPLLVVLATPADEPYDWLLAGQALERMLLRACADGLQASFLNQPVQVPALRPRLQALAPHAGIPQLVLRLGYPGTDLPPTPRRPLEDVLQADWPIP